MPSPKKSDVLFRIQTHQVRRINFHHHNHHDPLTHRPGDFVTWHYGHFHGIWKQSKRRRQRGKDGDDDDGDADNSGSSKEDGADVPAALADGEDSNLVGLNQVKDGAAVHVAPVLPLSTDSASNPDIGASMDVDPATAPGFVVQEEVLWWQDPNYGRFDSTANGGNGVDAADDLQEVSSEDADVPNESRAEHEEGQVKHIELSKFTPEQIWALFLDTKRRGGQLARSVLILAKQVEPKTCTPWSGGSQMEKKKREASDQHSLFMSWASELRVLEWLRLQIYIKITESPRSYKAINAQHAGVKQQELEGTVTGGTGLASKEATDNTMARIAHLAVQGDARVILNCVFGRERSERDFQDAGDLQPEALWTTLATHFVNNSDWDIASINCLETPDIDVTIVPTPGITGEVCKNVFMDVKKMFTDLSNAVFSPTGCNSTGEEKYSTVWKNFINGPMLSFRNNKVTMYVFKLWDLHATLPKYCTKDLHPDAKVRQGIQHGGQQATPMRTVTTPRTPAADKAQHTSSSFSSPASLAQTALFTSSMESVTQYCNSQMKHLQHQKPEFDVS